MAVDQWEPGALNLHADPPSMPMRPLPRVIWKRGSVLSAADGASAGAGTLCFLAGSPEYRYLL
jgi:alpha-D-ribose 1-methylphosphonate 5-triphosphate diphosphatase PhnM